MSYRRSYTPVFEKTNEELMREVETNLMTKTHYIMNNDAPYDMYKGNKVETEHLVVWYRDDFDLREFINGACFLGNTIIEVSNNNKSIPLPHIHVIKTA